MILSQTIYRYFLLFFSTLLLTACQTFDGFYGNHYGSVEPMPTTVQSAHPAHVFPISKSQDVIGALAAVNTAEGDTLSDVARHYGLGYTDISIANPNIAPWTPKAGSSVLLPLQFILPEAPRKGIVLNLATMRMFYYPKKQETVITYPVSIGREGWNTPMGLLQISNKTANPEWHVPDSIHKEHALKGDILPRVVRSGPYNPLGYYAMRLSNPRYLIHGTNKPYGIGMRVSHGCIQMYPEDIEILFKSVSVGTPVYIVHQPYLAGWDNDMLYIEIHDPVAATSTKNGKKTQFLKQLRKMARSKNAQVDWNKVDQIMKRADGIPTPVLMNTPDVYQLAQQANHLARPAALYGQPSVPPLTENDWSILVDTYQDETLAQRMTAMLTHQGPSIPARKIAQNGSYQVIAGPFKDLKETNMIAKRIQYEFEIKVQPLEPATVTVGGSDSELPKINKKQPYRSKKPMRLSKRAKRTSVERQARSESMLQF